MALPFVGESLFLSRFPIGLILQKVSSANARTHSLAPFASLASRYNLGNQLLFLEPRLSFLFCTCDNVSPMDRRTDDWTNGLDRVLLYFLFDVTSGKKDDGSD